MKKCLIIVDFQNDFVTGSLGFEKAKNLESIIESKVKKYLSEDLDLIYTLDTHYNNTYLNTKEGELLPIKHCIKETKGHDVYGSISKYVKNAVKVFEKETFGSLTLGNYLKDKKYDQIEIVGLVTNMCVISNAIIAKAALPNANIIIDSKAVMSFDDNLHDKSLEVLDALHMTIK